MSVSPGKLLVGGRYRVIRHLGSGGMATVLLCEDERLRRKVAVKRLHSDSPAEAEQRFVQEAKLGASLNHPNLVSVFDTATDDEGVLIVMEYVEGESLSRALKQGPLGWQRVAAMARDLGSALDHVHAGGVVHRDVKPGNVLLRKDRTTKLVDLGIATALDGTRITQSGTVLGTAAYMAPEQLEGGDIGPYTDIYALAAVCYEALAGKPAMTGRTPVEVAHRIASEDPPDIRDVVPKLPLAAAQVLKRGMARDPAERPKSAGELAQDLTRALDTLAAARARAALAAAPAASPPPSRFRRRAQAPAAVPAPWPDAPAADAPPAGAAGNAPAAAGPSAGAAGVDAPAADGTPTGALGVSAPEADAPRAGAPRTGAPRAAAQRASAARASAAGGGAPRRPAPQTGVSRSGPPRSGDTRAGGSRRPTPAVLLALVLLALAVAAVTWVALASDDGGEEGRKASGGQSTQANETDQNDDVAAQRQAARRRERAREQRRRERASEGSGSQATAPEPEPEPTPAPAPAPTDPEPVEQPTATDTARGAQLNDQGFRLIRQGNYAGAVPILQEAVASWPESSRDITYAYTLFNLGQALNRSGNPAAAIPYLEKRLTWDDQRETVQAELDDARRNAG